MPVVPTVETVTACERSTGATDGTKVGGGHSGVVHSGNGSAQDQGARGFSPADSGLCVCTSDIRNRPLLQSSRWVKTETAGSFYSPNGGPQLC